MADIVASSTGRTGRPRHSIRIDLTPMVDLGFLLITFFIFTTHMSSPVAMKLVLPAPEAKEPNTVASSYAFSVVVGARQIFTYSGHDARTMQPVPYGMAGIHQLLTHKRKALQQQGLNPEKMVVLLKPGPDSNYGQLVDLLDEMTIAHQKKSVLMEASDAELLWAGSL